MVIVFCIDPVGTFTACTIKVMPNKAMMTVTTADSKYSRKTDFGGPLGFVSVSATRDWPFRLNSRETENGFFSVLVTVGSVATLVDESFSVIIRNSS